MKVNQLVIMIWICFGGWVFAVGQDGDAGAEKWRKALAAESFQKREEAMKEIWLLGEKAVVFLEELEKDGDPEVAARAGMVLRRLKLGISPDTPAKFVKLIEGYWSGSKQERIRVLAQLKDQGGFEFIFPLRRMETDEMMQKAIDSLVSKELPARVRSFLNEGKREEATNLLALSDQFPHMIHLGHLLQLEGKLEGEIERLRKADDESARKRYLAYLRLKGDARLLRSEAGRLGDRETELVAALVEGDFLAFFSDLLEKGKVEDSSRDYVEWVMAEYAGDRAGGREILDRLRNSAKGGAGQSGAEVALFRMGYGAEVIEMLSPDQFGTVLNFHQMQEDYLRVEAMLELPQGDGFEAWLEKSGAQARKRIAGKTSIRAFTRLGEAASFLEQRGRYEEAAKCCEVLFEVTRGRKDLNREDLLEDFYYSAPRAAYSALAREIEENEQVASVAFQQSPMGSDYHVWLYQLLGKEAPKLTTRERVLLTFSFSNRSSPLVAAEKFDEFFERVFQRILKGEDKVGELEKFYRLLTGRNRGEEMRRVLEARAEAGDPSDYALGLVAWDSGDLDKAAKSFEKIEVDVDEAEPSYLFELGGAMSKAGLKTGEDYLEKARLFSDGGVRDLMSFSREALHLGEQEQAQIYLEQALLRSPSLPAPGSYNLAFPAIEQLATLSLQMKDWRKARACREVYALLSSYRDGVTYGHYYARHRFQALVARGAVAMEEGDVEGAVAAFGEAHRILPRDGYLANELFPVMREVGLGEYHDQLFAASARHARAMIERYPNDDNGYNNFAWMASRANRCLDEAEQYLKTALKLNPQSAAYLDTMGEIHFAGRNREEAVKWSERSVANATLGSAMNWELHQQNRRFKNEPFPPK